MRSFKTLQISDGTIKRFQDNVKDAIEPLLRLPIVDGVLIEGLSLVAGSDNLIPHRLGRQPRMWWAVDLSADSAVWRTAWDMQNLTLNCSADCRVSLWVA